MSSLSIDLLIRIKNGYLAEKNQVEAGYSKFCENILKILEKEKYINGYKVEKHGAKSIFQIDLLYFENNPAIKDIKIVSKPGRRVYKEVDKLRPVLGGLGIAILSTSKGVMTDKQAKAQNIGGEVLFQVW